ncbi:MAG: saccharopine dehydrogenase NADP-binding domain-containing protein [Cellulosilyticum sp.]|nr:saccharopine dehydrogenase NADP-binding domain-containing protein [Cellulosilyticum sp.]
MGIDLVKDKIVILGGYGQVGGYLSKALGKKYPGRVLAVGRNLEKAKAFEAQTKGLVKGRACNLSKEKEVESLLDEAQVVVMCFVPKDTTVVEKCIKRDVHYIDITPSYQKLVLLEKYEEEVRQMQTSIIFGVGICPGLTNLMVREIKEKYKEVQSVESTMLLGVGETYGMDALDWLLDNLKGTIELEGQSGKKELRPFREGKKINFLSRKTQVCYPIDLADQHIIPKTLGIWDVQSRFCYDVNWITKEVALMNRFGLISKNLLLKGIWVAQKLKIGTDDYVLQIKARVRSIKSVSETKEVVYEISGSDNAKMTAYVAAATVCLLLSGKVDVGVHYLEEITSLQEILTGQQLEKGLEQIKEGMNLAYQFNRCEK